MCNYNRLYMYISVYNLEYTVYSIELYLSWTLVRLLDMHVIGQWEGCSRKGVLEALMIR